MAKRTSPGSQGALRKANRQRIVKTLRGAPATQAEIAERTGLANSTVSNLVRDLRERGAVSTAPTVHRGRRAMLVSLERTSEPTVAGIDFGRGHVRIAVTAGDDEPLEDELPLPSGHAPEESLALAAERMDALLSKAGARRKDVAAVCVGVPSPVDRRTGHILHHAILPEWEGVTRHLVEQAFDMPVELANDADLGAVAESEVGAHRSAADLMYVKVGTGIGSGLILGGNLHRGAFGIAGELGHTQVDVNGALCVCGGRGCLETLASARVIARSLSAVLGRRIGTDDIVRQALAGDNATRRALADAGAAIGRAVANAANLLAPSAVIVGGPLAEAGELFLDPIRDGFRRFALEPLAGATVVAGTTLGARAEVIGALTLARVAAQDAAYI